MYLGIKQLLTGDVVCEYVLFIKKLIPYLLS